MAERASKSGKTKFIFITGGVVSSLGKGLASASIGALLEARGLKVTMIKMDPYINVPSHFAPDQMEAAVAIYRARFRPSERWQRPYVVLGLNVFAAPSDAEARFLFTSLQQAFVNLRTGRPGKLPAPVEGYAERLEPRAQALLAHSLSCAVVGAPETVRQGLRAFAERTGADELIVTAQIHDHAARLRSFEILADAHGELAKAA